MWHLYSISLEQSTCSREIYCRWRVFTVACMMAAGWWSCCQCHHNIKQKQIMDTVWLSLSANGWSCICTNTTADGGSECEPYVNIIHKEAVDLMSCWHSRGSRHVPCGDFNTAHLTLDQTYKECCKKMYDVVRRIWGPKKRGQKSQKVNKAQLSTVSG